MKRFLLSLILAMSPLTCASQATQVTPMNHLCQFTGLFDNLQAKLDPENKPEHYMTHKLISLWAKHRVREQSLSHISKELSLQDKLDDLFILEWNVGGIGTYTALYFLRLKDKEFLYRATIWQKDVELKRLELSPKSTELVDAMINFLNNGYQGDLGDLKKYGIITDSYTFFLTHVDAQQKEQAVIIHSSALHPIFVKTMPNTHKVYQLIQSLHKLFGIVSSGNLA